MKKIPKFKNLEERISFILMKAGVTGPEIDECMYWAFGNDAWYIPIRDPGGGDDWISRWKILHPDHFEINKKDQFVEVVYVVGKAFLKHKYGELTPPGVGGLN